MAKSSRNWNSMFRIRCFVGVLHFCFVLSLKLFGPKVTATSASSQLPRDGADVAVTLGPKSFDESQTNKYFS